MSELKVDERRPRSHSRVTYDNEGKSIATERNLTWRIGNRSFPYGYKLIVNIYELIFALLISNFLMIMCKSTTVNTSLTLLLRNH